jgi:uncharacterized membrane protein YkoI
LQALEHNIFQEGTMRTFHRTIALALALSAVAIMPAGAQQATRRRHETAAQLRAQAKITEDAARTTALVAVPGGKVESGELEREHGKLLASFDIKVAGKPGVDEVQVDAITGKLLSNKHETPAAERAEKQKEAKEHATKGAKKG